MSRAHAVCFALLLMPAMTVAQPGALPVPAASLVRPESRDKAPDADGFLQRWLILEPIPVDARLTDGAVQATVRSERFPDQLTVVPRDGDTVTLGE